MKQNLQPKIKLNNGHLIPQLGLGVWKASLAETQQMVKEAVMNDYVLIDTAKQYGNEAAVGQGIQDGFKATGRERDSIFLTTKIFNGDQGDYDKLRQAVKA